MGRYVWVILPTMLVLGSGVVGCWSATPSEPVTKQAPSQQAVLQGVIVTPDRQVTALISDVANGATVSLIDTVTGNTISTTVSNAQGAYSLYLPAGFSPVTGRPYFLEAMKGLPSGGPANRAGAPVARLRTILFPQSGNWVSLGGATPGSRVEIGWSTTAVSVIASLRGLSALDMQNLIGKVSSWRTFNSTGTVLTDTEFATVFGLVDQTLKADQDPVSVIGYDASAATPATQYGTRVDNLVIHPSFSPAKATQGGTVTFNGQNLPAPNGAVSVTVGGLQVANWTTNADRTQLIVTIPANGYSGLLEITQDKSTWVGPFVPVAGTVGTLVGSGQPNSADGVGRFAALNGIRLIGRDLTGNLIVPEIFGNRIKRITPNGVVTTIAGSGVSGLSDGTGTAAEFKGPCAACVDSSGNIYVAEHYGHRIRKITPAGVVTTLAGSPTGASGYADGPGGTALFFQPNGIAVDNSGTLYVADNANNRIRTITAAGAVSTLAGSGAAGSADGVGTAAQINAPVGLVLDGLGNLFVTEYNGHNLRKIVIATGVVSKVAGNNVAGFMDGTGTTAQFNIPYGLAIDGSGNFVIGDAINNRIRRVTLAGLASTLSGAAATSYRDGTLASALFASPDGISIDPSGNIYVADMLNNRIRVVTP